MKSASAFVVRSALTARALPVFMMMSLCGLPVLAADPASTVVRVEEDWELVIGEPDSNSTGPQVTCVISPLADVSTLYGAFEINHRSQPSFRSGGMQLVLWNGENVINYYKFYEWGVLSATGEVIRWTTAMEVYDGLLVFEVADGSSTRWGGFGGQALVLTSLEDLNSYSPDVSVAQSGAGYAGNRVGSLVLKRVRVHTADGNVVEDDTPRVVQ